MNDNVDDVGLWVAPVLVLLVFAVFVVSGIAIGWLIWG